MVFLRKSTLCALVVSLLSITSIFAQNTTSGNPPEEKKKLKIQLLSAGKIIPPNQTLTKADTDIQLKIFSFNGKTSKELIPSDIAINVIRNGKKIANQVLYGAGSIANLALIAKNEDTFLFEIKEFYEKNDDGTLKTYAKGLAKFSYLFYDANMPSGVTSSQNK